MIVVCDNTGVKGMVNTGVRYWEGLVLVVLASWFVVDSW